jgi:heat shock protein HtpX
MMLFAPLAAGLIQMAISRSREFEADATAARVLQTGEPLARALEKLSVGTARVPSHVNPAQASAYIANPLAGRRGGFASFFSTHPPMEQRIARLRSAAWA